MHKHDPARSGVTAEKLALPLAKAWEYRQPQPPAPAWPEPGKELNRLDFDRAPQPVAAAGLVYFGSSADDTVRALDAATGSPVWRFTAGGPIRFAPCVADGRLYVAADDGWVYCLDARTGRQVWTFRAAPADDLLLGNGRMISRWPPRSGVLVVDGTLYLTAGMWPAEGVYVYALDAKTGQRKWCNDSSGCMYMRFPHPVASGFGGVAPQGPLLVSGDVLLAPTGRNVPAAFDRHTGRLLYYKSAKALSKGGTWATVSGDLFFNPTNRKAGSSTAYVGEADPCPNDGMVAYSITTGEIELTLRGRYRVLAAGSRLFAVGANAIELLDLEACRAGKKPEECLKWRTPHGPRVYSLALADELLVVGGRGSLAVFDAGAGKQLWSSAVEGQVRGLAVAAGRVFAATDAGRIICCASAAEAPAAPAKIQAPPTSGPALAETTVRTARQILKATGVSTGYGLVLGDRGARLSAALAGQTDLHLVMASGGAPDEAARERETLLEAGLYGSRIATRSLGAAERLPFAAYFADLIVLTDGAPNVPPAEVYRVLRPCGGVLYFHGTTPEALAEFVLAAGIPREEAAGGNTVVRGPLPGAGEWRWPWADGGRSGVGADSRIRLPLELLWFGGPGPDRMMDRHSATSPPLSVNGRVFVTGEHHTVAFDAYNGRELWARRMQGSGRRFVRSYGANVVADRDSLYLVRGARCYRLDQTTGRTVAVYAAPGEVMPPLLPEDRSAAAGAWLNHACPYRTFAEIPAAAEAKPPSIARVRVNFRELLNCLGVEKQLDPGSVRVLSAGREIPFESDFRQPEQGNVDFLLGDGQTPSGPYEIYFDASDGATASPPPEGGLPLSVRGLAAAYDFDGPGDTLRDASGNGADGKITAAQRGPGRRGSGLSFDGKTSYAAVPPTRALDATDGLTVQAWVKCGSVRSGTFLYKAYHYGLFSKVEDGKCRIEGVTRSSDFVRTVSSTPLAPGEWHHVALTFDGETQRLFLNGKPETEARQTTLSPADTYLCLGASSYRLDKIYNYLDCSIDDVRIQTRALTGEEIRRSLASPLPDLVRGSVGKVQERGQDALRVRDWIRRGWGYVSVADGLLLGNYTAAPESNAAAWGRRAEGTALFALDKHSGALRWVYRPEGRVMNTEIAHGDGKLFLLDATSVVDVLKARRRGEDPPVRQRLIALDLTNGATLWRQEDTPILPHRTQTPDGQPNFLFIRHRSQLQYKGGVVVLGAKAAYDAADGRKLWQRNIPLRRLASIHGDQLIVPPNAYDLRTGAPRATRAILTGKETPWRFIKAYGCGATLGCKNLLHFRSGSFGFLDLLEDGTMVVVENGASKMGHKVDVVVTSVFQTSAGRMIFSKLK